MGPRASCPQKKNTKMNKNPTREDCWHNRGYLQHFDSPDTTQAVTFRLFDSLPQELLKNYREELELSTGRVNSSRDTKLKTIKKMEQWLDLGIGSCLLCDPKVASIVKDALFYFDNQRYTLDAWIIMPNHVHLLIHVFPDSSLSSIVFSIKSYTAKQINRTLSR